MALEAGLASAASPKSRPHTPQEKAQRTRRVSLSPVLSIVDTEGLESFELEDIRLLERTDRDPNPRYEVPTEVEGPQTLKNQVQ